MSADARERLMEWARLAMPAVLAVTAAALVMWADVGKTKEAIGTLNKALSSTVEAVGKLTDRVAELRQDHSIEKARSGREDVALEKASEDLQKRVRELELKIAAIGK